MRKTKKGLAAVLAVSMTMGMLTGCGSSTKEETKAETKATEAIKAETAGTESADEEVNLRFLSWLSSYEELDKKVAEAYKKEHPNVNVTFEYYGDMSSKDYNTKVDLMTMGGEKMDILMTSGFPGLAQRANSGAYLPMDEYLEKEGIKAEEAYVFAPKVNDHIYGVPGDLKSYVVLLNKDYLDEAGLSVPNLDWTWDDYREYAKKMTTGEGANKRYGSYLHSWDTYDYLGMWSVCENNPIYKEDMSGVNFDHPVFKDWVQFRYDLENVDKTSVPYGEIKSMNISYRDKFFNGEVAMLPVATFILAELDDVDKYPHDFVTTFAPIPAWKDAESGRTYTEAQYYAISKTSEHPQEAYDFIRYYTTEGMRLRGVSISAENGINKMDFVENLLDDPSYVDMDALSNVLNNPKWYDIVYTNVPSYNTEMTNLMLEEVSKFLLDSESLDQVIQSLMEKGTKLMQDNK